MARAKGSKTGWDQIMKDVRDPVPAIIFLFSFPGLKSLSPYFANVTYF